MSRTPERAIVECSICGRLYQGFGHNAHPINGGRCCNVCNDVIVIPARIRQMRKQREQEASPNDQH